MSTGAEVAVIPVAPALSVVVTIVGGVDALGRCLTALGSQREAPAMEVIVPSYLWRFRKTGQFRHGRFA